MSNKMALDALTAALDAMEHMANTLNNMDAVDEDEDAQHDAAFEAVRAAIAALQAEPQPETERDAFKAVARKLARGYADRASSGATTQAVRMLTEAEQTAIIDMHNTGRAQGDHECAEDIQHKFAEVNGLRIPADGKIGSAA